VVRKGSLAGFDEGGIRGFARLEDESREIDFWGARQAWSGWQPSALTGGPVAKAGQAGLRFRLASRRHNDIGFLHFDETAAAAGLEFAEDGVHLFLGVDELDADGKVIGQLDDVGCVYAVAGAETGYSLHRGGAGDALAEEEIHDAGVDRDSVAPGGIAQVESDFHRLA